MKDEIRAILERVPTWPEARQQELVEIALEIEAELAGARYETTPDELAAIGEGLYRGGCELGRGQDGLRFVPARVRVEYSKRAVANSR
jgi:hypothetical protein